MQFVIRLLKKSLDNERRWLQAEALGSVDPKYREGARMARERVPQLTDAIKLLQDFSKPKVNKQVKRPRRRKRSSRRPTSKGPLTLSSYAKK